jgi:predicted nucleic acid-binding protein
MRYVLDSSVALKWVLPERDSDKALRLRDRYRVGSDQFIAPDFFPVECGHGLFRAERRGILASGQPSRLLTSILVDRPQLYGVGHLLARAAGICSHIRKGFYDCVYMALAEQEGVQLITADEKLVRDAQGHYPYIVDLATVP